jgi:hypothetical protein
MQQGFNKGCGMSIEKGIKSEGLSSVGLLVLFDDSLVFLHFQRERFYLLYLLLIGLTHLGHLISALVMLHLDISEELELLLLPTVAQLQFLYSQLKFPLLLIILLSALHLRKAIDNALQPRAIVDLLLGEGLELLDLLLLRIHYNSKFMLQLGQPFVFWPLVADCLA